MIYLDNAATTLHKPPQVMDAVVRAMTAMGNAARGAHGGALEAARTVYNTRVKLARLFGCPRPDHVIFTANATEALNIAISGLIRPGDHVITTDCEHNSVLRPLYRLEEGGAVSAASCVQSSRKTAVGSTPSVVEMDGPPWEEERPPLPEAPPEDEPPWDAGPQPYSEPACPVSPVSEKPKRKKSAPAAASAPCWELWGELVEQYKNRLTPMYWFMLDDARGTMEGDEMVVRCGDELTMESLNCPEVSGAIGAVTGEKLGRPVRVRFALGGGGTAPEDKLEELIRQGSRFDSFIVKP